VCYAFSLPSKRKIGEGFTKRILRESMRNVLPEEIRVRKSKIGFSSPMINWYKLALKSFVLDSVNSQAFLESNIWNGPLIRDFTEKCYRNADYHEAIKSWKYIQAMHLMKSFEQKAY
jgi:asparagine synthase (glutamine-hydrolysing)